MRRSARRTSPSSTHRRAFVGYMMPRGVGGRQHGHVVRVHGEIMPERPPAARRPFGKDNTTHHPHEPSTSARRAPSACRQLRRTSTALSPSPSPCLRPPITPLEVHRAVRVHLAHRPPQQHDGLLRRVRARRLKSGRCAAGGGCWVIVLPPSSTSTCPASRHARVFFATRYTRGASLPALRAAPPRRPMMHAQGRRNWSPDAHTATPSRARPDPALRAICSDGAGTTAARRSAGLVQHWREGQRDVPRTRVAFPWTEAQSRLPRCLGRRLARLLDLERTARGVKRRG
ncbi:hypothetical protein DFH06DRAFT_766167 [Mycena polygramma]|nr:hypothetical protein DFH06DRAFT_766167 [Mycena polygramma]